MKKCIGLIIAFLFFSNHVLFCSEQIPALEQPQPFATNALLIFLDNQEKEIAFVLSYLMTALDQKSGPILASTSLFQALLRSPDLNELSQDPTFNSFKGIFEKINSELSTINTNLKKYIKNTPQTESEKGRIIIEVTKNLLSRKQWMSLPVKDQTFGAALKNRVDLAAKIYFATLKSSLPFNPNEWIIKQVNPDLLLLIPKQEIQKKQQQLNPIPDSQAFTKLELSLGLKIDHMQNVESLPEFIKDYVAPNNVSYFLPSLPEIFITNQEYAQINQQSNIKIQLPRWAICIIGHGGRRIIVQLTINEFKSLLDFLEKKIKTTLFAYISCYSAGSNAVAVYNDLKSGIYRTYPFTIITAALIDSPVYIYWGHLFPLITTHRIDYDQKKINLIEKFANFREFTRYVTSAIDIDFSKAFSFIWPTPTEGERVSNFPQIKLAGIPWFNVADTQRRLVSLGEIMSKTRTEPLNVTQFFKTEPLGILLQRNVGIIPFPVIIDTFIMPKLISMAAFFATHVFKELNTPNINLQDFFDSFETLKDTNTPKTYVFFTLTVAGDFKGSPTKTYHNIVIELYNPELNRNPHIGITIYAYGKNELIYWYDENKKHIVSATDDTLVKYNLDTNKWDPIIDDKVKKDIISTLKLSSEQLEKTEKNSFSKQLGFGPRKEAPQKLVLPTTIPGQEEPQEIKPAKPIAQKITPAIAPKPKPVAKPVPKAPVKKLSPAQLKKAKQEQAKKAKQKAIAKKKQDAIKKKAAIKGKKVISKKPVVQKKKAAAKAL